jgi:arylsulfatase A-like enzyme
MSPAQRPNLVLIMTDQQRGDCLGLTGSKPVLTPNLDALAAGGTMFDRAYSTCPACIPARRSLMSGLSPQSHGMVGMVDGVEWEVEATLPGLLRDSGYQTFLVGRHMHLYPRAKRYGFDHMEDTYTWAEWLRDRVSRWEGGDPEGTPKVAGDPGHGVHGNGYVGRPHHLPEHLSLTNWTVRRALQFLDHRDPSCPFFLVVSFAAPHPPLTPPPVYFDRYLRMDLPEPVIGDWAVAPPNGGRGQPPWSNHVSLDGEAWRSCAAGYYGLINHVDDQIAPLVDRLRRQPEGTVIAFTSDHGEMLGDHHMFRKTVPYEGSAHIPLFVNGPGIEAGKVRHRAACLEDLMPTFLSLGGVPAPPGLDGEDLLATDEDETRTLHIEYTKSIPPEQEGYHCLTDGVEKYIWKVESGREQLFDLVRDPQERHDLAASAETADRLQRWRSELITRLADRPEGFTDGRSLIAGRRHESLLPHATGPGR